ncbi:hypothetical protein [Endozoicomonas lisbonensis]|uniref:hypothetical protein n=1 Tax=Endozoicomonas lisbonensis TaxID=3120522 RepID=UPI00339738F9
MYYAMGRMVEWQCDQYKVVGAGPAMKTLNRSGVALLLSIGKGQQVWVHESELKLVD